MLLSGAHRRIDHYSVVPFFVGCAFDSGHAYLAYSRSAEVSQSSIDGVHNWAPYGFAGRCVQDFVEGVLPSQERDGSGVLGANSLHAA